MANQGSTIKVHLWKPRLPNVGHLSMQLSDGTYVSFWPDEDLEVTGKQRSTAPVSYAQDVIWEGNHQADEILELPEDIVDQEKIKLWWSDYTDKNKYNLLRRNCALVVREALLIGGIFQTPYVGEGGSQRYGVMIAPGEIFQWIKECKSLYPRKQDTSIAAKMFRGIGAYFSSGQN